MREALLTFLCALAAGTLSAWGVGGGTLLLLGLTLLLEVEQRQAQTLNLLFFLPAAAASALELEALAVHALALGGVALMGAHLDGVQAAVLLILAVVGAAVHRALDGPVGGAGAVGVVVHGVISSLFPCIRLLPGIVWPDREGFIQGPPCAAGLFFFF